MIFRLAIRYLFLAVAACLVPAATGYGADRALLVGIDDYLGTAKCNAARDNSRDGCIRPTPGGIDDVNAIRQFLIRRYGFSPDSIKLLTGKDATAANIRASVAAWLIDATKPGDRVFFHFSGHGTQVKDDNGDESDELDEAFVPYDAEPKKTSKLFILDDEVSNWVRDLKGRRIVMLFDSCHSGTISRGADPGPDLFPRYLPLIDESTAPMRGGVDRSDYSFIPKDLTRRDRGLTKDAAFDEDRSSAVIISAAEPYQQAFPIKFDGKFRGALSYLFEKIQENKTEPIPSPRELETKLRAGMQSLAQNSLLPIQKSFTQSIGSKFQNPSVEIFSDCSRGDMPLFDLSDSPTCKLKNDESGMSVKISMKDRKPVYLKDEEFKFNVDLGTDAYLYVIVFSENNIANSIYPRKEDADERLRSGVHYFPKIGGYWADVPFGRDIWVALVTKRPLGIEGETKMSWNDMFSRIGLPNLIKIGPGNSRLNIPEKLNPREWAAATIVLETRER